MRLSEEKAAEEFRHCRTPEIISTKPTLAFDERFSGPQTLFPAPIVGSARDARCGFVLPIPLAEGIGSGDARRQGQDDWRRARKVNIFV